MGKGAALPTVSNALTLLDSRQKHLLLKLNFLERQQAVKQASEGLVLCHLPSDSGFAVQTVVSPQAAQLHEVLRADRQHSLCF